MIRLSAEISPYVPTTETGGYLEMRLTLRDHNQDLRYSRVINHNEYVCESLMGIMFDEMRDALEREWKQKMPEHLKAWEQKSRY